MLFKPTCRNPYRWMVWPICQEKNGCQQGIELRGKNFILLLPYSFIPDINKCNRKFETQKNNKKSKPEYIDYLKGLVLGKIGGRKVSSGFFE